MKIPAFLITLFLCLPIVPCLFLEVSPLRAESQPKVLAVVSHSAEPYTEAVKGLEDHFSALPLKPKLEVVQIDGDTGRAKAAMERAGHEGFHLVVTLGSVAAKAAAESDLTIPVVAGLVLNLEERRGNGNIHWVFLDIPMEVQFEWLSRILPNARNIGIMFDPLQSGPRVEAAIQMAERHGLSMYPQRIERPSDIPEALTFLSKRVDALLGIPDHNLYNPQTTQHILLFSLRNRIPFIGLSEAWVRAGAFYSLDCDYRDVGLQCAELAEAILTGRKTPQPDQPIFPRKVVYILNMKTAGHMKIGVSQEIIEGAHKVFR